MTPERPPDDGHVRPTAVGPLLGVAAVGLLGGWLLRPVGQRLADIAPVVTWVQVAALFLVAGLLGWAAWTTWRTVHVHRRRLEVHRAVNRLVLAKACAVVGALMAGGYAGYGISWVGMAAELADQRMLRSALAALAGVLICVAALLLERACRVRDRSDEA